MARLRSAAGLALRDAELADVSLLARWRSDPRVLEFYGGRDKPLDPASVRSRYFLRRRDSVTGRFYEYRPCIVETDRGPVGFVQYYRLPWRESALFGYAPEERVYAVDYFIGETSLWGRGLGPRLVELVRDYLVEARSALRVVADPRVTNPRSVRSLEKAGFRKVRLLPAHEVHEGVLSDCWLMEYP